MVDRVTIDVFMTPEFNIKHAIYLDPYEMILKRVSLNFMK